MPEQINQSLDDNNKHQPQLPIIRFYQVGILLMLLGFILCALALFIVNPDKPEKAFFFLQSFSTLGSLVMTLCFCWELYQWIKKVIKHSWVGPVLLGIPSGLFVSKLSQGWAEGIINEATKLNPEPYANSIGVFTAALSPIVLSQILVCLILAYYIFYSVVVILKRVQFKVATVVNPNSKIEHSDLPAFRFIASLFFAVWFFTIRDWMAEHIQLPLRTVVTYTVIHLDHYPHTRCPKASYEEIFFKEIGDNKLSVVKKTDSGVEFSIRACEL